MKSHGILHRIVMAVGLFLGITATGASVKASTNQPVNTTNNNSQTNHLDQNSIQNNKTTLVNQQDQTASLSKMLEQQPKVQTDHQIGKNDNRLVHGNQDNNQVNDQKQSAKKNVNQQTDQLYHHIISRGVNDNHSRRFNHNNSNYNVSQSHDNTYRVNVHQYSIGSTRDHSINRVHRHFHIGSNRLPKVNRKSSFHNVIRFNRKYNHKNVRKTPTPVKKIHHSNWFRDGLNRSNLKARSWVSMHESSHRWYVLSYGHVCVGYFQLNPHYLGYRHGHIDLRPKHQVKVADRYVSGRYGNWVNAKRFWKNHHWY